MVKNKYRIPEAHEVRFELVAYHQLYLRKVVQVVTGPGEVAEVDVTIDLSLTDWDKLRKAIKKARNRKKEKAARGLRNVTRRVTEPVSA